MTSVFLRGVALIVATLVLHVILIQPNHPNAMTWQALLLFPLELPFLILLFLALPASSGWARAIRAIVVLFLVIVAVLKVADLIVFTAFNRSFNPLVDLGLIEAGIRLLGGTIGPIPTALVVIVAILAPFLLGAVLWWASGVWSAVRLPRPIGLVAGFGSILALGLVVAEIGDTRRVWQMPFDPPGTAFTGRVALERATAYNLLFTQLGEFRRAAAADPFAQLTRPLDVLESRDVLLVFVESYGRASFDNPLYAPTHGATIAAAQDKLESAGLAMRSGWVTSPISGGQSWLAHGTLASGLRTSNQALYTAMLASERKTIWNYAAQAGYETTAVMPAITLPWPEANLLGFGTVHAAADLGYRGEPFNWVTMPDQYTLSAFERLTADAQTPAFTQIALISSHAPWVPVPDLIDWDAVGDGTVFNEMATSGDPPSVVWRDRDRIRDQYRLSIDYSLETMFDYAARTPQSGDRLTIIVGDHPPTLTVSGIESFDVPMHVIGPPDMIDAISGWGWTEGLVPAPDLPAWPMEAFRDRFLDTFSTESAFGEPQ